MVNSTAKSNHMDRLIRTTRMLSRINRDYQSHPLYYQMLSDYYSRLLVARQNGGKVVAHTIFFPVEILYAMDLVPLQLEFTSWMISLFGGDCGDVLSKAAEMGLAQEICSAHRLTAGALDLEMFPPIDAVICSNLVCDNSIKSGELTAEVNHCPVFLFEYPFHQTGLDREYVVAELKEAIDFLEQATGHKMDWDKLSANITEINRQIELERRIGELCKKSPSPFLPQDFLKFLVIDYMFAGRTEMTQYLETLCCELEEMVAAGKGFAEPERLRLMALMITPPRLLSAVDAILKEHGASIVCSPILHGWSELELDPRKPLESLAKKLEAAPPLCMFGELDERMLGHIRRDAKDYNVNGVINFAHIGCRQTSATIKMQKDLMDSLGIPLLNIDCDLCDSRITSEDDVRKKLEQFFELLEDQ